MNLVDSLKESLSTIWESIVDVLPTIAGAIIGIIIGILIIKLVVNIIRKSLKFVKADKLDDKLNEIDLFGDKKIQFNVIDIVAKFVKWMLYIILVMIVTDLLNLTMISDGIKSVIGYMPKLITALAIFVIGLLFANFVKKSLQSFFESMELSGGKMISQAIFMLLLIFISITALNQAGVDTEIITSNITMILAAFLLAFALAVGFGAQKVVGDLFRTFYTRKIYEVGQKIEFDDIKGEIESIDGISVTLKTSTGKIIVPIKDIVESQVRLQD
ncbi:MULTISPECIES: mechanosensitive ion channel domain-containing protein [unclassified Algibacter]|uniref:mechanosensitive ion channel family protein n=1 Tax=unclassified Algibacter TaxID=2615009 RepID=UPI00131AF561|nr:MULTISPECIES: mechanosensitive ion channel domain-containing protein [unclassified Algibacter]MCL5130290.1 mechanosensitive ion channel [Algibacter sp. L4_22]